MMVSLNFSEPVKEAGDAYQLRELQQHFTHFYKILAKATTEGSWDILSGLQRCCSGIDMPYNNTVIGVPNLRINPDAVIKEQLGYFKVKGMPFVWYVDESVDLAFTQKLQEQGFVKQSIFRGVCGALGGSMSVPQIPENCTLEAVTDVACMNEFCDLVGDTFGLQGTARDLYKKVLWEASQQQEPTIYNWVVKEEGKVVSALSTFIEGNIVSFWNGATLESHRRKGLSTALRCFALNARPKVCTLGASFLMGDAMALGICKKLGFETKWRFNAFLAPAN